MDELTIKQKAEAYDKAIEQLRDFYRNYDTASLLINVKEELANMFPELKESEDERIKTFIRGLLLPHIADVHLEGDKVVHNKDIDNYRKALTWLDKQKGEKDNLSVDFILGCLGIKPAYKDGNAWSILLGDNIQEGICGFGGTKEEALIAFMKDLIENQGKQKPNPYSGTSFEYNGHTWGMCARDNGVDILYDKHIIGHFEKQGATKLLDYDDFTFKPAMEATTEEKVDNANKVEPKDYNDIDPHFGKPIDKVEPKFKVGDWIIFNGLTLYIKEIVKGYYRTISKGGITNSYDWGIDNTARLWTIQDAKPGDVLAAAGYIILFKKLLPHDGGVSYCHYDYACTNPQFNFNEDDNWLFNEKSEVVHPATEEQIKLLFVKMKEAGYEWDAEKKELKKIEDELITDAEIPFGAKDSELEEVFYSIPNGFHAEIKDDKVVIKKGEKKPACSNEHYELEEFAKIVRCNLTGISKAVQKLFEAKYLQLTGNEMYGGLKN